MVQKGCRQAKLEGLISTCFMILLLCRFQNHASHQGREAFFEKWWMFCKKRCLNHEWHKENCRSYTKLTKLLQRCIHSFLLTGLWGRKMHGTAARSNILMRAWSEKIASGTGKRAKKANTITKKFLLEAVWVKKLIFG